MDETEVGAEGGYELCIRVDGSGGMSVYAEAIDTQEEAGEDAGQPVRDITQALEAVQALYDQLSGNNAASEAESREMSAGFKTARSGDRV